MVGLSPNLDLTRSPMVQAGYRLLVYQRIASGFGPMPAFSHTLEAADLELLTAFTLRFKADAGAATAPPAAK